MASKRPPRFDVKRFLAKIGAGRALVQCRKRERISRGSGVLYPVGPGSS
jgi:hypothetical protein